EAMSSTIDLPDDDPSRIEEMLRFLYTGRVFDYSATLPERLMSDGILRSSMTSLVALYSLGDKYGIPTLCRYTEEYFEHLTPYAMVDDLLYCVPEIYHGTPESNRDLRDAAVRHFIKRSEEDIDMENTMEGVLQLSDDIKQFRDDVITALILAAHGRPG
ncbi:MAG: hypothetical protein Q9183_006364, partial [Haloplaca sp. 2 TL-2023]